MRRFSSVCFTVSKPWDSSNSPVDNGKRWYSNFLPVSGSLSLFCNSNEEEPVTSNCTSGKLSVINFRVSPMFSTLCASSIMTILCLPMSNFSSWLFTWDSISFTSGPSQFNCNIGSVRFSSIILKSVLFPTCLAPIIIIALPPNILASIVSCSFLLIILFLCLNFLQR